MIKFPPLQGTIREQADLSAVTWFQVGGRADYLFKPKSLDDLCQFLASTNAPVMMLGVGSNLLVRDGGIEGVVIRLGRAFAEIKVEGEYLICGAAALDKNVAMLAAEHGLAGLEFLVGIPGTIGGALAMNAGAYGADMSDVLESCTAVDRQGKVHELSCEKMGFTYRHNAVPDDWIFTHATLKASKGDKADITARMNDIMAEREKTQPVKSRTGGSTFKNPDGFKAWQLIDEAGCRGLEVGGAKMSDLHCNFMINTGEATASDLERLGEEVRKRVKEHSGIELEWEIKCVGRVQNMECGV